MPTNVWYDPTAGRAGLYEPVAGYSFGPVVEGTDAHQVMLRFTEGVGIDPATMPPHVLDQWWQEFIGVIAGPDDEPAPEPTPEPAPEEPYPLPPAPEPITPAMAPSTPEPPPAPADTDQPPASGWAGTETHTAATWECAVCGTPNGYGRTSCLNCQAPAPEPVQ